MRTVIVRLVPWKGTGAEPGLHGLLEVPGRAPAPFTSGDDLLAALTDLVREDRTQASGGRTGGPTLRPPEPPWGQ